MNETTWNYRVVVEKDWDSVLYSIREVYYRDGKPKAWTEEESSPLGNSLKKLRSDYKMMAEAFEKPVLIERGNELVEDKE